MILRSIGITFFIFLSLILSAQQRETNYRIEAFSSLSSGAKTPFWMLNHTWGMVPLEANNAYLRAGIFHDQKINKNWSFSLGLDVAMSSPHAFGTVWVQQVYGVLNWKTLRLNIGSKEDYTSFLDEKLSSGDFNLSNNARPAPEFRISTSEFIPIPDTEDMVYIKGDFAVGKYLDGDYLQEIAAPYGYKYVMNTLSHHKSLYLRIGNIERRTTWQFIFGLDSHAQWGGDVYVGGTKYEMTRSMKDFIRVFFAMEGGSESLFADKLNVAGNQSGTYLAKFDYKIQDSKIMSLYWQHYFEDKSGLQMENYPDMLLGLQYKSKEKALFSGAVLEYFYTKNQSGPIHFNLTMDPSHANLQRNGYGMDNYYNNTDYIQGRSYYGRSLGNPLFLSPEYNEDGFLYFKSNRIFALHGGLEGNLTKDFDYLLLLTYGETFGRYDIPLVKPKSGVATVAHINYHPPKISGLDFRFSFGLNSGSFFGPSTTGFGLTVSKRGIVPE